METINEKVKTDVTLTCKLHGEYKGYRIELTNLGYSNNSACPTCISTRKLREAELAAYEASEKLKKDIALAGFPLRFLKASLETIFAVGDDVNILIRDNLATNKARIERLQVYANTFDVHNAKNVLILGDVSVGKTFTACALGLSLIKKGRLVVYMNTADMLNSQKSTMYDKEGGAEQLFSRLAKADLLILDEFGKKLMTAHETAYFDSIINARYENMVPTVLVSNLTKENVFKMIGLRAARRIEQEAIILGFQTPDESASTVISTAEKQAVIEEVKVDQTEREKQLNSLLSDNVDDIQSKPVEVEKPKAAVIPIKAPSSRGEDEDGFLMSDHTNFYANEIRAISEEQDRFI